MALFRLVVVSWRRSGYLRNGNDIILRLENLTSQRPKTKSKVVVVVGVIKRRVLTMEYYSALAKRRRLEKQQGDMSVVAPSPLSLQTSRKSSRLLADVKLGPPSSTTTTKSSNDGMKQHVITRRGTKRNLSGVPSSEEIGATTIATRRVVLRNGRSRALCFTAGCNNLAVKSGVCCRHGAPRKVCTHEGCNTLAYQFGFCCRHGAPGKQSKRKLCSYEGCTNQSKVNGVCSKHGAKRKICNHGGCTNQAQSKGVCFRHGAPRKVCTHKGCNTLA